MHAGDVIAASEHAFKRDETFDAYVDEQHGELEICGQLIAASDALATDPVKYGESRTAWILEREEELANAVIENFPYPIAHRFRRFKRGSRTAKDKRAALQDCWEAVIHVLFAFALAEMRAHQHVVEDAGIERRWIESQTIAARLQVIDGIVKWGAGVLEVTDGIDSTCLEALRELNSRRNDVAHRADMTEQQAEREVLELEPLFMRVVADLSWLADWQIVRPTGTHSKGRSEFEMFTGHSAEVEYQIRPIGASQRSQLTSRDDHQHELYVLRDDAAYSLSPILHWLPSGDFHHTHVGVLKKRDGDRLIYEVVGRSEDVAESDSQLLESLQELKDMFTKTAKEAS